MPDHPGPRTGVTRRLDAGLRVVQALLAVWLLMVPVVLPVVLPGPDPVVAADVLVGGVLLTVTVAAAASASVRRAESAVCAALGAVLIVASVLLEPGPGGEASARQWNEVVAGVVLVCLAAARTR